VKTMATTLLSGTLVFAAALCFLLQAVIYAGLLAPWP
jgi:hypothetical protein